MYESTINSLQIMHFYSKVTISKQAPGPKFSNPHHFLKKLVLPQPIFLEQIVDQFFQGTKISVTTPSHFLTLPHSLFHIFLIAESICLKVTVRRVDMHR